MFDNWSVEFVAMFVGLTYSHSMMTMEKKKLEFFVWNNFSQKINELQCRIFKNPQVKSNAQGKAGSCMQIAPENFTMKIDIDSLCSVQCSTRDCWFVWCRHVVKVDLFVVISIVYSIARTYIVVAWNGMTIRTKLC